MQLFLCLSLSLMNEFMYRSGGIDINFTLLSRILKLSDVFIPQSINDLMHSDKKLSVLLVASNGT